MTEIIDGEIYYSREELDVRLDNYIKESADDLIIELAKKQKSKSKNIESKEVVYV